MPEKDRQEMLELAEAAVAVMGDSDEILEPKSRPGDWLAAGAIAMGLLISYAHIGIGWAVGLAIFAGWAFNERERLQIKKKLAAKRAGLKTT